MLKLNFKYFFLEECGPDDREITLTFELVKQI